MKIIGVEEHFTTLAALKYAPGPPPGAGQGKNSSQKGILDYIDLRLNDMDEADMDMQVLSFGFPRVEDFDPDKGTDLARDVNDQLSGVIKKYPKRFAGFATLAPQAPESAAAELERSVKKLGLKGTMIFSNTRNEYLDARKYWVIFETAEQLNVPVYIHPKEPSKDMIKPYLGYPALSGAMLGFAAETSLHAIRLICSGLFDKYPKLKIMLGHMGEAIPFWLWRMDKHGPNTFASSPDFKNLKRLPSEYFRDNFYVTTSGMLWHPVLKFVKSVLGPDRILFGTDYPPESSKEAVEFIESAPISKQDRNKICHVNAERLLDL